MASHGSIHIVTICQLFERGLDCRYDGPQVRKKTSLAHARILSEMKPDSLAYKALANEMRPEECLRLREFHTQAVINAHPTDEAALANFDTLVVNVMNLSIKEGPKAHRECESVCRY